MRCCSSTYLTKFHRSQNSSTVDGRASMMVPLLLAVVAAGCPFRDTGADVADKTRADATEPRAHSTCAFSSVYPSETKCTSSIQSNSWVPCRQSSPLRELYRRRARCCTGFFGCVCGRFRDIADGRCKRTSVGHKPRLQLPTGYLL